MIQFINFLLITLILYNLFNSNILEQFSGCSKSKSNAVYRQQALTDRLFGKINKLEAKYNQLNMLTSINRMGVSANSKNMEGGIDEMNDDLEDKQAEMKKIGKKPSKPIKGKFKGSKIFARAFS